MAEGDVNILKEGGWNGIDLSTAAHLLPADKLADGVNIVTARGNIRTRRGWSKRAALPVSLLLGGNPVITALIRFQRSEGGGPGGGDNIVIDELTEPTEDYNEEEQDPENEEEEPPEIDIPEFPGTGWTPGGGGGFSGGGGGTKFERKEDDDDVQKEKQEEEPDEPDVWYLKAHLPFDVYWGCYFNLTVTAHGRSGSYDGSGANLIMAFLRNAYNEDVTVLNESDVSADLTTGWSDNEWSTTARVTSSNVSGYLPCQLGARGDINGRAGKPGVAPLNLPKFRPSNDGFSITGTFPVTVRCEDSDGNLLENYDDSGTGLTGLLLGKKPNGAWSDSLVQGGFDDASGGWADSEWSGTVDISLLDNGCYLVGVAIGLFGEYRWIKEIGVCPASISNYDEQEQTAVLTVMNFHGFSDSAAGLSWYGYNDDMSEWEMLSEGDEPTDTYGTALDLTKNWEDKGDYKEWSETFDTSSIPSRYSRVQAIPHFSGTQRGMSNMLGAFHYKEAAHDNAQTWSWHYKEATN